MVVYVILFVTPSCASPIKRLTQRLVTLIASLFSPALNARVTSTRKGSFQTTPKDFPFTITSARFFTSPRSNHNCVLFVTQFLSAVIDFVYVAVPEKYFIPGSVFSVYDVSLSNEASAGALRSF